MARKRKTEDVGNSQGGDGTTHWKRQAAALEGANRATTEYKQNLKDNVGNDSSLHGNDEGPDGCTVWDRMGEPQPHKKGKKS